MFGMATVLRQCGAMYMRRSFKNDKLYGAIFRKYVQTVVSSGSAPFEFFIEGTRSRCGKSLSPKLGEFRGYSTSRKSIRMKMECFVLLSGLLKMVTDIYLNKDVPDLTLVPITISYDRVIEDFLFAREVLGVPKPKESTTVSF